MSLVVAVVRVGIIRTAPFGEGATDMSETTELKKKQTLTRQEAAARLVAIAEVLTAGAGEIDLAGERISLPVADQLRAEIEIKTSPGKCKLEIELAWSTTSAGQTGTAPEDDS
jgi:amphi-Trp domain-containing protein